MESYTDEHKIEIRMNTIRELLAKFDALLSGLNTEAHKFKSAEEKNALVDRIRQYADYRIAELSLSKMIDLKKILVKISKCQFKSISTIEKIYIELLETKHTPQYRAVYLPPYYRELEKERTLKQKKKNQAAALAFSRKLFG